MAEKTVVMNDRPRVVGVGEILWDILPGGIRHLGGAPMNVAVHAQALGCAASVIGAVGDDNLGGEALELLIERHGLDASAVAVSSDHPTGAVDIRLEAGQPTYEFRPNVAWDFLEASAAACEKAQIADAVVFGTLAQRSADSRRAIHVLLDSTRPKALRVFDVNLRPPFYSDEVIRDSLARAQVLKLNDAELPVVLEAIRLTAAADWPRALFDRQPLLRLIALTRGEHGSTVYTPDTPRGHTLPAKAVAVQDTVGAGDAFTAAVVAGLLRGAGLDHLHRHAVELAAYVCSRPGATPSIPSPLAQPPA